MPAIVVEDLHKSYGAVEAVRGVDFEVQTGEVFALLGPNGAGKTSVLEVLEGFRRRTRGRVEVLGADPATGDRRLRERVGVVLQETAVEPYLTVREVLTRNAGYYPRPRPVAEVISLAGLGEKADARVKTLSGGQQRRLDVALGIVGDPELVFLDEPTTGLDPRGRRVMWQIIGDLVAGGTTIFLTTQYLEEADQLADRIVLLDHGRLVAEGTPDELKRLVPGGHVSLRFGDVQQLERGARTLDGSRRDDEALTLQVPSDGGVRSLRLLLDRLDRASIEVENLSIHTPDLEDVFLALTGRPDKVEQTDR